MDKKALQSFALLAKDSLETQIKVSLKLLGIHSDKDIKKAYIQGDFTIIDGDSKTYPSDLKLKRDHILELIKTDGYAYTIEQFAYTWFNRLIVLRFMEVHDYLPHGFKVFPKGNGSIEPEILGKLTLVEKELSLDIEFCRQFKEKAKIEELYRYVLFQQCNALSGILPMLFSKEYAYLELMLPSTLLKGMTVITELIKIDESNFLDDVEVIGWLYQFYVSSDREEFRKAKVVNKDLIPTLTQIFTPDWIVRYMTENSLGRLWLESYPDSSVKKEFKYYVEDAEQTEEVKKQIESIRYKNVDPKDIKVIEPCSGSGHILVYAFDVLMLMYEEKGYSKNDIPKLILDNNLFGLDVDKRASQLASFSLVMKARSIDSRFFQPNRISYPKVFEIKDSKMLISMDYKKKLLDLNNNDWKKDEHLSDDELKVVDYVVETFVDGKVIGSLLKVKRDNYVPMISKINHLHKVTIRGIFNGEFVEYGLKRIVQLLRLAEVMSRKYDVMITNPPYLGISKLDKSAKDYLIRQYPLSKNDMFSMFMENHLTNHRGFNALVNPDGWMFIKTFQDFRRKLLNAITPVTMIHLGMGAFDAVVQTTTFVTRNAYIEFFKGIYFSENSNFHELNSNHNSMYFKSNKDFLHIPGSPIAYWIDENTISIFKKANYSFYDHLSFVSGNKTSDNDRFLRYFWEISEESLNTKYFICAKGGAYKKWYGNMDIVIDWSSEAKKYYKKHGNLLDEKYVFKSGITYTDLSSRGFSARMLKNNMISDMAGPAILVDDKYRNYYLGFLNSIVASNFLKILNNTIHFKLNDIQRIPFTYQKNELIDTLVEENIRLSKENYNSIETSIEFSAHPLSYNKNSNLLRETFKENQNKKIYNFSIVKQNEERINEYFIKLYNMGDTVSPNIHERDITFEINEERKEIISLLSFIVGIIFGRFKSNHSLNNLFENKILILYDVVGMKNGLDSLVFKYILEHYGEKDYKTNLDFLSDVLGKKQNESSEEAINRYLYNDFIEDHIKLYQKRPIYWLFSSGKLDAFKCLLYIHSYNEDTIAAINSLFLLPESARLKYELNEINKQLIKADEKTRRALEKTKTILENKYTEIIEYGQVIDHMANRYISIDLDDGIKANYEKFQGIEIVTDSGTRIKKDLLVTIK